MTVRFPFTPDMTSKPLVKVFYDEPTNNFSYLVKDPISNSCAVIDSVADFDYPSGRLSYHSADEIIAYIKLNGWSLEWVIETHVHADHITASNYIKRSLGGKTAISEHVAEVQKTFAVIFNEEDQLAQDGTQFDHLFKDGESFHIGNLQAYALQTPGHTPACITFVIGDAAFVGDTLFMPDGGTARADFPGGDAHTLYQSIQRILSLPAQTRIFVCHDYQPDGREVKWETSVAQQRSENIHVNQNADEDAFIEMRKTRDKQLGMPRLIIPSLQINMRAGDLPAKANNGTAYLKVPINKF